MPRRCPPPPRPTFRRLAAAALATVLACAGPAGAQATAAATSTAPTTTAAPAVARGVKVDRAVLAVIGSFNDAMRRQDAGLMRRLFDVDRLVAEIERQDGLQSIPPEQLKSFTAGVGTGLGAIARRHGDLLAWDRWKVQRVEPVAGTDGREVVVYTRQWDENGIGTNFRWWLRRDDGGRWRLYDYEDLDGGLRVSTGVAAAVAPGLEGVARWSKAFRHLESALRSAVAGRAEEAQASLGRIDRDVTFPAPLEGVRWMTWASTSLALGRPREALEHADRAAAVHPDMPILSYVRAGAELALGHTDAALVHAERYREALGGSSDAHELVGDVLAERGDAAGAADAYRRALDDDPQALDSFVGLAAAVPAGRLREVGERLAAVPPGRRKAAFEYVAAELGARNKLDALEALVTAYRAAAPDDPSVAYYDATVKFGREQFRDAAEVLRPALDRAPADERSAFLSLYFRTMSAIDKHFAAYEDVDRGDEPYAFDWLADELAAGGKVEPLRELIAAHASRHPRDGMVHFYTAEAHRLSKEYDAADAAYARAAAWHKRGADEDLPEKRERIRRAWVVSRLEAGRGVSAYQDVRPKDETFVQLVHAFQDAKQPNELERLAAARRADVPRDPMLPLVDAEAYWLRGAYAKAADRLLEGRDQVARDPDLVGQFEDRLVRSLIRARRLDAALDEAKASTARDGDPYYELLVHANAGRAPEALTALKACVDLGYDVGSLYTDEDLGPALRGPAMGPVREAYPEPVTKFDDN